MAKRWCCHRLIRKYRIIIHEEKFLRKMPIRWPWFLFGWKASNTIIVRLELEGGWRLIKKNGWNVNNRLPSTKVYIWTCRLNLQSNFVMAKWWCCHRLIRKDSFIIHEEKVLRKMPIRWPWFLFGWKASNHKNVRLELEGGWRLIKKMAEM